MYCLLGLVCALVSLPIATAVHSTPCDTGRTVLLSKGTHATQSSVGWDGVAERAVDGRKSGTYGDGTCTHTQNQANNWWMVDLGKTFKVKYVRLYNRQDCCRERLNGAIIRVGNNPNGMLTNPHCGGVVNNAETSASQVISRQCSPQLTGRYVSVSLTSNFLTLCEVEVWGEEV
ncbi:fucolectin-like isoform X2 [Anneissia japonica]|uniref:fucolectin-like isoform X2 n=1 Tax=Anneissia japonica TaxID=1529436 RepID=UPI0014259B38|nr:fucolectin-like isoform X2 [Anneissia japonica]